MLHTKNWIKGSILSLLSFVFSWLVLEGVCNLMLRWKHHISQNSTQQSLPTATTTQNKLTLIKYDSLGIIRPAPGQYEVVYSLNRGQKDKEKPTSAEKKVSVIYHIDSLDRRVTPFYSRQAVGKYALFLGCSFTYGESVADTSTLPYFFGKETGYRPYNYGVSGYSPAHMLALMQAVNMRSEVLEKDGVAFYTYIEDHLARVAPSTKWIYNSNGYWPNVDPGTMTVKGTYAERHPVSYSLIRGMYKSNIVNLFNINFPRRYTVTQYQRFVNIVKKTEEQYVQQFGNDNFYVVVFPAYPMPPELRQLFEQNHIKVIDYSALCSWKTAYDGMHPDEACYRHVASQLAKKFK
ncbi:hypothetical protein Slin_4255 [Spirosoma linguale DSM 74]|uniref:Uncharacterized protein n=1 Tax=Spirosoma linguale (strain ATCC 33905 / DSM 74 / LMG 10896 / Claus 1) TaxID=504472 RepID=D2QKS3_SPILD|nr:hypothetical protein Slin_4255 [Spirosoma linguale DSM 74]